MRMGSPLSGQYVSYMSANSKGTGETALMRRLACALLYAFVISTLYSNADVFRILRTRLIDIY